MAVRQCSGDVARRIWILTFHAACGRILRRAQKWLTDREFASLFTGVTHRGGLLLRLKASDAEAAVDVASSYGLTQERAIEATEVPVTFASFESVVAMSMARLVA